MMSVKSVHIICAAAAALVVIAAGVLFLCTGKDADAVDAVREAGRAEAAAVVKSVAQAAEQEGSASSGEAAAAVEGLKPSSRGTYPCEVVLPSRFSAALRDQLVSLGARNVRVVSFNTFRFEASAVALARIRRMPLFEAAVPIRPDVRLDPLLKKDAEGGVVSDGQEIDIALLDHADRPAVGGWIRDHGGRVAYTSPDDCAYPHLVALIDARYYEELASLGEVTCVTRCLKEQPVNDRSVLAESVNIVPFRGENTKNLTGDGQLIGHCDTGLDSGDMDDLMPDFTNQVSSIFNAPIAVGRFAHNYTDIDGHGTHTAGSIVGNGSASGGKYRGIAYGAKLVHQNHGANFHMSRSMKYGLLERAYVQGARIHSNSWSAAPLNGDPDAASRYNDLTQVWDEFIFRHPEMLVLACAGNFGKDNLNNTTLQPGPDGLIDPCSAGAPSVGKNIVCVGAATGWRRYDQGLGMIGKATNVGMWPGVYTVDPVASEPVCSDEKTYIAAFSSRGPTLDGKSSPGAGRIKPDIVAPGTFIVSTRSRYKYGFDYGLVPHTNENGTVSYRYNYNSGTSMACPIAAGTAALMREYVTKHYRKGEYSSTGITNATSCLLRAMFAGGARPVTSETPNNDEGWGHIDLERTIAPTNGTSVYLFDRLQFASTLSNTVWSASLTLFRNTPFTAVIAWTDYPSPSTPAGLSTLLNDFDLRIKDEDGNVVAWGNDKVGGDHVNTIESIRKNGGFFSPGRHTVEVVIPSDHYMSGSTVALYLRFNGTVDGPNPYNQVQPERTITPFEDVKAIEPVLPSVVLRCCATNTVNGQEWYDNIPDFRVQMPSDVTGAVWSVNLNNRSSNLTTSTLDSLMISNELLWNAIADCHFDGILTAEDYHGYLNRGVSITCEVYRSSGRNSFAGWTLFRRHKETIEDISGLATVRPGAEVCIEYSENGILEMSGGIDVTILPPSCARLNFASEELVNSLTDGSGFYVCTNDCNAGMAAGALAVNRRYDEAKGCWTVSVDPDPAVVAAPMVSDIRVDGDSVAIGVTNFCEASQGMWFGLEHRKPVRDGQWQRLKMSRISFNGTVTNDAAELKSDKVPDGCLFRAVIDSRKGR